MRAGRWPVASLGVPHGGVDGRAGGVRSVQVGQQRAHVQGVGVPDEGLTEDRGVGGKQYAMPRRGGGEEREDVYSMTVVWLLFVASQAMCWRSPVPRLALIVGRLLNFSFAIACFLWVPLKNFCVIMLPSLILISSPSWRSCRGLKNITVSYTGITAMVGRSQRYRGS